MRLDNSAEQTSALFIAGRSRVRLYRGDSLAVLPALEAGSVGTVVTSPPYNLGIKYRSYEDDLPRGRQAPLSLGRGNAQPLCLLGPVAADRLHRPAHLR